MAGGFAAAESVRNYRFFTNAFATTSHGVDVVSTWTPLALRGNTVFGAVAFVKKNSSTQRTEALACRRNGAVVDARRCQRLSPRPVAG